MNQGQKRSGNCSMSANALQQPQQQQQHQQQQSNTHMQRSYRPHQTPRHLMSNPMIPQNHPQQHQQQPIMHIPTAPHPQTEQTHQQQHNIGATQQMRYSIPIASNFAYPIAVVNQEISNMNPPYYSIPYRFPNTLYQMNNYPRNPIPTHQNANISVAGNQEIAQTQMNDIMLGYQQPKQSFTQTKPHRVKTKAIIQDPNNLKILSDDDLLSHENRTVSAPTAEVTVSEQNKNVSHQTHQHQQQNQQQSVASTDVSLEFQNKISALALKKDTSPPAPDVTTISSTETSTVASSEVTDKHVKSKSDDTNKINLNNKEINNENININDSEIKTLSVNIGNNTNISESNEHVKGDEKDNLDENKLLSDENNKLEESEKLVNEVNKVEISRTPSPVTSSSSSTVSTPSMSMNINSTASNDNKEIDSKIVDEQQEMVSQANGDINESSSDVKECKDISDEYKLESNKVEINNEKEEKAFVSENNLKNKENIINEAKSFVNKDELNKNVKQENEDDKKKDADVVDQVNKEEKELTKEENTVKDEECKINEQMPEQLNEVKSDSLDKPLQSQPTAEQQLQQEQQSNEAALKAASELIKQTVINIRKISGGKLEYESQFLRKLQTVPASLVRPTTLPDLEIIHDSPICSRPSVENRQQSSSDVFYPNFLPVPNQNRNQSRNISMRSSQGGRSNSQHDRPPRRIISPSLTQEVKLHTVENAWKPKIEDKNLSTDDSVTDKLSKGFRGILNKLTPEKYDKLLSQVQKLQIDTVERLELVLKLIFEKAVDEPAFCLQYANLCKHLCGTLSVNVKDENDKMKTVQFSHLLVTKCQQEFEGKMYEGIDVEGRRKEISQITDEEKKKMMRDELDDEMRRARKRSLGNIKLIGELYKLGTIKCFVMVICVKKLLADGEEAEESLECLCTLLRTIGQKLEEDAIKFGENKRTNQETLSLYYVALQNFTKSDKISSRVRFMIQDILDLRSNGWKERKAQKENRPKTITEIHKEAQEEETKMLRLQQQQQQQQQQLQQQQLPSFQKRQDSMKKEYNLQRKSQSGTQTIQAFKSIGMSKPTSTEPTLGPSSMGSWGKGAGGGGSFGASGGSSSQQKSTTVGANRFAVLSDSNKMQGRGSSQNKEMNKQKDNLQESFVMKKSDGHPSGPPPFGSSIKQFSGRASNSKENTSVPNSRNASVTKESLNQGKVLSESEIRNLIDEYLSNKNLLEIGELKASLTGSQCETFVKTAIDHALEVSSQVEQDNIGILFKHLLQENILNLDNLREGFKIILECENDIIVDVPKLWHYLANIFAPVFIYLNDVDRRNFFVESFSLVKGADKAAKCMSLIIARALELKNTKEKVSELWSASELKWSDFLNSKDDEKEFITKNNLAFLDKLFIEIEKKVECNISDEALIDFIQEKFSKEVQQTSEFVSALFKSVVKGCLTQYKDTDISTTTYTLQTKKLNSKCKLLSKFCNNEESNEIGAIFSLQKLANELSHPPKMLNDVFQTLHENNVISLNAFIEWEKSKDMLDGKAMAVLNVKQFLTWLKEGEESEEEAKCN